MKLAKILPLVLIIIIVLFAYIYVANSTENKILTFDSYFRNLESSGYKYATFSAG